MRALQPAEPNAPHNTEAEQCVLGSCLIDPEAFLVMADLLCASDFFHPRHRDVAEAMVRVAARGEPTDFVLVSDELARMNKLDGIGGEAMLARLLTIVPTAAHVEHYAQIVRRCAANRALITLAGRLARDAYTASDPLTVVAMGLRELESIRTRYTAGDTSGVALPLWSKYTA